MNRGQHTSTHERLIVSRSCSFLTASLPYFLTFLVFPSLAQACPMCKEALFEPEQLHQRLAMAKGYALSIGLMLSVPLLLVATVVINILLAQRRHSRSEKSPAAASHSTVLR